MVPSAGSKLVKPWFGGLDSGPIQNNPVSTKRQIFGDLQKKLQAFGKVNIGWGIIPLCLGSVIPTFLASFATMGGARSNEKNIANEGLGWNPGS